VVGQSVIGVVPPDGQHLVSCSGREGNVDQYVAVHGAQPAVPKPALMAAEAIRLDGDALEGKPRRPNRMR